VVERKWDRLKKKVAVTRTMEKVESRERKIISKGKRTLAQGGWLKNAVDRKHGPDRKQVIKRGSGRERKTGRKTPKHEEQRSNLRKRETVPE